MFNSMIFTHGGVFAIASVYSFNSILNQRMSSIRPRSIAPDPIDVQIDCKKNENQIRYVDLFDAEALI